MPLALSTAMGLLSLFTSGLQTAPTKRIPTMAAVLPLHQDMKALPEDFLVDPLASDPTSAKNRHCAFCLKPGKMTLCAGCCRRAYCSRDCQAKDWNPGEGGQGHSVWCSLPCGEEDIDWEVRPVPSKGVGLIALKDLPRLSRVLVDGFRKSDHPAIMDLLPAGGSREDKIVLNGFYTDMGGNKIKTLYLRGSRINHSCYPSAFSSPDHDLQCTIMVAARDIRAGEEITVAYMMFTDPLNLRIFPQFEEIRSYLAEQHGIHCPAGCLCRSKEKYNECARVRALIVGPWTKAIQAHNTDLTLLITDHLLYKIDKINAPPPCRCNVLSIICDNILFEHRQDGRYLKWVGAHIPELVATGRKMTHPDSVRGRGLLDMQKKYEEAVAELESSNKK